MEDKQAEDTWETMRGPSPSTPPRTFMQNFFARKLGWGQGSPSTPSKQYASLDASNAEEIGEVPDSERRAWAPASNLDVFFSRMYLFYYERGFTVICVRRVTAVMMLGFTIFFAGLLALCIDWPALVACTSRTTCEELKSYIVEPGRTSVPWRLTVSVCLVVFSAYWLWMVMAFVMEMRSAWEMHKYYRDVLQISTRRLQTMHWHDVVVAFDRSPYVVINPAIAADVGPAPVSAESACDSEETAPAQPSSGSSRMAHYMAMRIMRKENYIIALINQGVLDLTIQLPFLKRRTALPFTKCMEWNLSVSGHLAQVGYFCFEAMGSFLSISAIQVALLNWMITDTFQLRDDLRTRPQTLARRFWWCGLFNLIAMPFVLPFLIIYFAFKHAEDFQSRRLYLGPRKWSPLALWKFREYNELPHVLDRRMSGSVEPANLYCRQFPSHVLSAIAKCVSYITGALVSVFLAVALVDDALLTQVTLGGKNLLWYIAVCSAALAVSRALMYEPEEQMLDPKNAMRVLAAYTHYMPPSWRRDCHTYDVRDELQTLFRYRMELFVQEIAGVFLAPLVFMHIMVRDSRKIAAFLTAITKDVRAVGAVCSLSLLDPTQGEAVSSRNVGSAQAAKLQKSVISFYAEHSGLEWLGGSSSAPHARESLVCRVQRDVGAACQDDSLHAGNKWGTSSLMPSSVTRLYTARNLGPQSAHGGGSAGASSVSVEHLIMAYHDMDPLTA